MTSSSARSPFQTEERDNFVDSFSRFVKSQLQPYAGKWDEESYLPWEIHAKIGEFGVWGLGVDQAYGGLGFDDATEDVGNLCLFLGSPLASYLSRQVIDVDGGLYLRGSSTFGKQLGDSLRTASGAS